MKLEKLIIDVRVKNLDRAVEFYKSILGFPLIHKDRDWTSFEALGAEIHLYLHGGIISGLEFRVSNIEEQIEAIKNKGVEFFTEENQVNLLKISGEIMEFPWGKAAFLKDSEGNRIVLVEDK